MATPFDELRKLAASRRDRALEKARIEYNAAIQDIAALEHKLTLKSPTKRPRNRLTHTVIDTMVAVIPTDRAFTLDDMCGMVREAEPERSVAKGTVTAHLKRLVKEGVLKRVTTAAGNQRATYAVPDFECDDPAPTILDMAESVLRDAGEPMTATEIMVAMLDLGFVPDSGPKRALDSLVWGMKKRGKRFHACDEGWTISDKASDYRQAGR